MINNMKDSLVNKIEQLIEDSKHRNEKEMVDYLNASKEYQELVRMGLTKKRGYNLMTPEEVYSQSGKFFNQSI